MKTAQKTNNYAESELEVQTASNKDVVDCSAASWSKVDLSVLTDDIVITTITTTLSVPDSMGRQYVTGVTKQVTERSSRSCNNIVSASQENSETVLKEQNDVALTLASEQKEQSDTKQETKISTPSWVITLIASIFAVVLVVILVILRHYRII